MNNKIIYISKDEAKEIKMNALKNQDVFLAEIEGARIRTEEEYVQAMADAFAIPQPLLAMKIGFLNDWMSNLLWIKQKDIVLIFHDYDLMLLDDLKAKKIIMLDFEEIILPWWEGDVVGHIVNGIIDELEILTADSAQIDTDKIELERVEYEINQEVNIKKRACMQK